MAKNRHFQPFWRENGKKRDHICYTLFNSNTLARTEFWNLLEKNLIFGAPWRPKMAIFVHFWPFWGQNRKKRDHICYTLFNSNILAKSEFWNLLGKKSHFWGALTAKNGHSRPFLDILSVKIGKNKTASATHSWILTLWLKQNFEIC